jgi:hypothetical protein
VDPGELKIEAPFLEVFPYQVCFAHTPSAVNCQKFGSPGIHDAVEDIELRLPADDFPFAHEALREIACGCLRYLIRPKVDFQGSFGGIYCCYPPEVLFGPLLGSFPDLGEISSAVGLPLSDRSTKWTQIA